MRTLVRAGHIIAFQDSGHRHLRDGVVVWEDDKIIFVGSQFDGEVDETVDAQDKILTPGFINTHTHLTESPLDKSFVEDRAPRQFFLSGLYEFLPARDAVNTREARRACLELSVDELIRTGTTTVVEIGPIGEDVVEIAKEVGLRAYVGQGFRSGRWFTDDGKTLKYEWFADEGLGALEKAVKFIECIEEGPQGLIRGFLTPLQIDTSTEKMLVRTRAAASDLGVPLALHASQSVPEFHEMIRRNGRTPIEWLNDIGFLGPDVILGHAIIVGGSSWTNYHADDIGILADSGTNVAHCAWVFARRGQVMESFGRYRSRGVNMTLATDTTPQSMIQSLRWTAILSKMVDRRTESATAADVFNAATINGAKALGRDDIGRISVGAKADMLLWEANSLWMTPVRDPIRNIVYSAEATDVSGSIIDGR